MRCGWTQAATAVAANDPLGQCRAQLALLGRTDSFGNNVLHLCAIYTLPAMYDFLAGVWHDLIDEQAEHEKAAAKKRAKLINAAIAGAPVLESALKEASKVAEARSRSPASPGKAAKTEGADTDHEGIRSANGPWPINESLEFRMSPACPACSASFRERPGFIAMCLARRLLRVQLARRARVGGQHPRGHAALDRLALRGPNAKLPSDCHDAHPCSRQLVLHRFAGLGSPVCRVLRECPAPAALMARSR